MVIPTVRALLFMKLESSRLHRKNIKPFCGKPLCYWILETLNKSKYVVETIVNTDSEEIADLVKTYFPVTVHMRPDHLLDLGGGDEAYPLMAYDIELTQGEYFVNVHSTTPLMSHQTLDKSIETFFNKTAFDSLISVTPIHKRLYHSDGTAINHDPHFLLPTQELPLVYEENSCIYIFSRNVMDKYKRRVGANPFLFEMSPSESIDIDEMHEFNAAEALMKLNTQT